LPSGRPGNLLSFGGRVPTAVGGIIVATVVVSLVAAVGGRSGLGLQQVLLLDTGAVWQGEVWRLITWVLVEDSPLNLLFGGLVLFWFGRDLVEAWGERRFLLTYFAVPAVAGVLTSLLALPWPGLDAYRFAGFWVALEALVVAWGLNHLFALPAAGAFVPHLLAVGIAWVHVSGKGPGKWLRTIRLPRRKRRGRFEVIHAEQDPDRRWLN
jgi:membrane associated rhomboid family serine protease